MINIELAKKVAPIFPKLAFIELDKLNAAELRLSLQQLKRYHRT